MRASATLTIVTSSCVTTKPTLTVATIRASAGVKRDEEADGDGRDEEETDRVFMKPMVGRSVVATFRALAKYRREYRRKAANSD